MILSCAAVDRRYFASGVALDEAPSAATLVREVADDMAKNRAAHYGRGKVWSFDGALEPECLAIYERRGSAVVLVAFKRP